MEYIKHSREYRPNTENGAGNKARQRCIFDNIRGVWIAHKTQVAVCYLHRKIRWSTAVVNGTRQI